jgi:hypothetical protein
MALALDFDPGEHDTRRQTYTIELEAATVRERVGDRIFFREERVAYWLAQRAKVQEKLRNEGVSVKRAYDQFDAGTYSNNFNAARGPQVVVDPEISRALMEAEGKVKEHEDALRLYRQWDRFLGEMDVGEKVQLTFKDYLFFWGDA